MRFSLTVVFALLFPLLSPTLSAQSREEMKSQAESRLQQMTPEQIDAKIREYGMTREQAEAKAAELGIDLNTYLQVQSARQSPRKPEPAVADSTLDQSISRPIPSGLGRRDTSRASQRDSLAQYQKPEPVIIPAGRGGLSYFGYEVFSQPASAFEPTASGPVDPEYLVGPGDVLRITVWGQVELQHELTVDKEGRVFVPTIGQFMVSGLTLQQATETIKRQMSRSYSGLSSAHPSIFMDVSLARLKPKRVYIMGEVKRPGGYTVSSYATVFSALYSVGGPTVKGSLRDVRIIRDGKVIAHVDLYDYLTGADQTNDSRVQNNDIIFVPVRGKTVGITDEVRKPAIYEMKEGENLKRLVELAGGPLSTAYLERIQIDRIIPFKERKPGDFERKVIDVDFRALVNSGKDQPLYDEDFVTVYSINNLRLDLVQASGPLWHPGTYQLDAAPTVRRLIDAAGGFQPKVFVHEAHIVRYNSDWITRHIIPFSVSALLADSTKDIALQKRDSVIFYSTEATEFKKQFVTIRGEVKNPGQYPLFDGMSLRDLILEAGGYTDNAEMLEAEVARVRRAGLGGDTLAVLMHPSIPGEFRAPEKPGQSMDGALPEKGDFALEHRDEILIRPNPRYRIQQNIAVAGDMMYPGVYALRERSERLSSILRRAGGPTTTSFLAGGEYLRKGKRVATDFQKAFDGNLENDVIVLPGDSIYVPSKPRTVMVAGQVNRPGLFTFIDGDAVSDYIERAGGKTDSASYAIYTAPTGESKKVKFGMFRSDPSVMEGSTIEVTKVPYEAEGKPVDISGTIKDMFAILMSAATVIFLGIQATK